MATAILSLVGLIMCFAASGVYGDPPIRGDYDLGGANATAADFVFTGFRNFPSPAPGVGFVAKPANFKTFPILSGQGVSYTKYTYAACGQNPPHIHPRAAELLYVIKGKLSVGLVDSDEKLYLNELKEGDVVLFPRGLVHWQQNFGPEEAIALLAFTDSNPGIVAVNRALFSSKVNVPDAILRTAFGTNKKTVKNLKRSTPLAGPLGRGIQGCVNPD